MIILKFFRIIQNILASKIIIQYNFPDYSGLFQIFKIDCILYYDGNGNRIKHLKTHSYSVKKKLSRLLSSIINNALSS